MKYINLKIKALIIFILFIFQISFADENNIQEKPKDKKDIYKIEIIIFRNNINPQNINSSYHKIVKHKNITTLQNNHENKIEKENLSENSDPNILLTKLDFKNFSLKEIDRKIEKSKEYQIIAHYAWLQDLEKSESIYFTGGKNYIENQLVNANAFLLNNSDNIFKDKKIVDNNFFKFLKPEWEIEGIISLQKFTKTKIHTKLELLTNLPVSIGNYEHFKTFLIKQNRNINLNEINYYDNPYFGAILYITKQ